MTENIDDDNEENELCDGSVPDVDNEHSIDDDDHTNLRECGDGEESTLPEHNKTTSQPLISDENENSNQ